MKRLLLSRWLQTLFGTALLAGLLWEFGPLWPPLEPVMPRVRAVQTMVVAWALANALVEWRRRGRDTALSSGLTSRAAGQEADAVGETLAKALGLLRKAGRRGALSELPWYAIIGPPGAGKTTALLNAGLTFTLADQMGRAPIAGVGGTRLCEWWFTDRAVMIDTAGRYTTQDSNAAVDRAGWEAFLDLLRRTRPRQPLNGVIVAIGLPDMAQASAAERSAHGLAISIRIAELQARFGLRIPVYAMFTKMDLITGFMEFFDTLDAGERDQILGETFAVEPGPHAPADRFAAGFRDMVGRLNARLVGRMLNEHRADRRGAILGFPTQLASLEKPLSAFIAAAFPADAVWLRGVYFTSGTQEGTPIDRLTGAMARTFGIDQARAAALRPENGRSYFLGRLLRDVVFGEAMLVRAKPAVRRVQLAVRAVGLGVILLAVIGATAALMVTSRTGASELDAVAAALTSYEQAAETAGLDPVSDGDLRPIAALLDRARDLTAEMPRAQAGFGMDQATKLDAGARQVYFDGLVYGLLPRLVWRLETQIRGSLGRPDTLYGLTRIYLMLGGIGPLNTAEIRSWMQRDWQQSYPGSDDDQFRASLAQHLDRLLTEPLPALPLDTGLVAAARASLGRVPLADRVYDSIRTSARATALPPWRPLDVLGPAGVQVFTRASGRPMTQGIPGLFTADGYRTVLLPSIDAASRRVAGEGWVSGRKTDYAPSELQELQAGVIARYGVEFTTLWSGMLDDLNVSPVATLPQAAQALYILASPDSPLRALLRSAAAQVAVPAFGGRGPAPFQPLVDLASGDGAGLERSLRLVADIQQQLAKIAALPVGTALPPGGDDIGVALTADALRQPQPLSRWLAAMASNAQALRTGNARSQLVLLYNAPGGPAQTCQAAIVRYPFAATGAPLPLGDFARAFGPGGMLDAFLNTQLKPFVDMSTKPWKPQPNAPITPASLLQFQRANAIRDAFFIGGQATPLMRFEIVPTPQPGGRVVTLTLAGTRVEAGKTPVHAVQISWPAAEDPDASLAADPPAPPLPIEETGVWAMFRLFARGRIQAVPNRDRQAINFPVAGSQVAFELKPVGAANPFSPGLFADFRCPVLQ